MSMMISFVKALFKYLRYYPDAKLMCIYEININNNKIFTVDKKILKKVGPIKHVKIKRRVICRTLY